MRKFFLVFCLVVALSSLTALALLSKPHSSSNSAFSDSLDKAQDILPQILALNNGENLPIQDFRTGHVNTAKLSKYLTKTDYGYTIQLPSSTIVPTPAVVDGRLYLSGGFGSRQYYCFNSSNGDLNWAIDLDDDGPSSPAIADGAVVFNTESCTIFACDMVSGKPIWSYYLGDPLMSMPTTTDGIVFTAYPAPFPGKINFTDTLKGRPIFPAHVLIAIEIKTGKILWQKWIDSDIMSAPVAKDDLLYVSTFSGGLYKFKQRTGEILEAKAARVTSAPVFSQSGQMIVSHRGDTKSDTVANEVMVYGYNTTKKSFYKKEAAYLDKKVQEKARLNTEGLKMDAGNGFAAGAPVSSNFMAAEVNIGYANVSTLQAFQGSRSLERNGRLYSTMGDEIVCTDSAGNVKWKHKLDGDIKSEGGFMGTPPIMAGKYIIVATLTGQVLLMDESEGKIVRQYNIKDAVRYQPVVDNGWIYVSTVNGKLHAINTEDKSITGWNMWGGNAKRTNSANN